MAKLSDLIGTSSGGGKILSLPTKDSFFVQIPLHLPVNTNSSTDFSSTGNFTQALGITTYRNFTINASHQMTVEGPTIIYCSGTCTIGGNGIVGVTTNATSDILEERENTVSFVWDGGVDFGRPVRGLGGAPGANGTTGGIGTGGGGGGADVTISGGDGGNRRASGTSTGSGSSTGGGGGGARSSAGGTTSGTGGGTSAAAGSTNAGRLIIIADTIAVSADVNFNGTDGTNSTNDGAGGPGGGSAGYVMFFANTFTHTAGNITCNGGNGGNGANADTAGGSTIRGGGGGGAGGDAGLLVVHAETQTLTGGTRTATVGTGGTGGTGISGGGDGGAGANGGVPFSYGSGVQLLQGSPF